MNKITGIGLDNIIWIINMCLSLIQNAQKRLRLYLGLLFLLIPYIYTVHSMGGKYRFLWVLISISIYCQSFIFYSLVRPQLIKTISIFFYLLFLFSSVLHFRYFEGPIRLGEIYSVRNIGFILDYIPQLVKPGDLIFFLSFLASIFLLSIKNDKALKSSSNIIQISIAFIIITLSFSIRLYIDIKPRYVAGQNIFASLRSSIFKPWDRLSPTRRYGFIPSLGYDMYISIKNRFTESEKMNGRDLFLSEQHYQNVIKELPDIFLIQVESLDFNILNRKCNGIEITPFLNSLCSNSYFFTKIYAQHTSGGGTSDADFSVLTSFYPLGTMPSFVAKGHDRFASLPFILRSAGYNTVAFHLNSAGFWGRSLAFRQLGFNRFFSRKDFQSVKKEIRFDHDFFNISFEIINNLKKPIFAYLITKTSHGPYNQLESVPSNASLFIKGDIITTNYFKVINYVDNCLSDFVKKIKNISKNYIIIIYGDHTSRLKNQNYASFEDIQFEKIPIFIILSRDPSNYSINSIGSQIDIAPTILSLLNISPPSDWQGINLFTQRRDLLILKDTDKVMDQDEKLFPIKSSIDRSFLSDVQKYLD